MSRHAQLGSSGGSPCGCDCGDCGGYPVVPLAVRPSRLALLWKVLIWFAVFLVASLVGGTFGSLFVPPCEAQDLRIDTSTAQYKENKKYIDSLVQGPFLQWAKRFPVPFWRITVRGDSLGRGDSQNHVTQSRVVAETYVNEPYRNAMVIIDVR